MRFELRFYEDARGRSPVLRWLREELTPTQRRAIGLAMAEISRIERGQANPTPAALGALASALGLDIQLVRPTAPLDRRSALRT